MKKKTFLRFLPALLIAPILACCVTVFATADEIEGQTFYNKIIHNIFSNYDKDFIDSTSVKPLGAEGYTNVRYGAASKDNKFNFNTYVNAKGETVAYLSGIRSGMLEDEDFINNILVIPMSVFDSTGAEYHVEGVESNSFCGDSLIPLSEDDMYRNHIKNIVITGYTEDGNGGWFKKIKSNAFNNYYLYDSSATIHLESITLPDSVESWDTAAFNNNETMVTIKTQKIKNSQLVEEDGLPSSLNYIAENSFADCHSLTFGEKGLILPPNITYIGFAAFYFCTSLASVDFINCTKLTEIQYQAFQHCNCKDFTHLKLPNNVETIGDQAFVDCCYLNNIELNENLISIGQYCFAMTSLETTNAATLEYIFIPESVTLVNIGAFQNNANIKEIIVGMKDANNANINTGAFSNLPKLLSVTFLWNTPRLLNDGCFNTSPSTAFCESTKALDVRFRPLVDTSEFGSRSYNYWVTVDPDKKLDYIAPAYSRLMLIAAFDNDYYGNDLKKYLNESNGMFDNGTFEILNNSLKNGVKYTVCITIPDVLKLSDTGILKSYANTTDSAGKYSKGIEFIYDDTNVHQITHDGKEINRPADDGVLRIKNNAIQVNSNNTLYVTYRSKSGTKSNPCVWDHTAGGTNNPFQNTYNYLTADISQMDNLKKSEEATRKPIMLNNEPEVEIVDEEKPLLFSFGSGEQDVEIRNACCFFAKPGGEIGGQKVKKGELSITDITFGGIWTDNSVPDKERESESVGNTCDLGCVYNDGDLSMSGCVFQNSVGTWGGPDEEGDSYGGSCLFNFRTATVENCIMKNCEAAYDGGAIMNADLLTVTNCTFDHCSATHYGGAIFNNVGDGSRGGTDSSGLTIKGCEFTNNSAGKSGGALYYCNGSSLELDGTLTFSENTDKDGTGDVYIGKVLKTTEVVPFTLGTSFSAISTITLTAQIVKKGLVVCSGGASAINSFAYQNDTFELAKSEDEKDIILNTGSSTTYAIEAEAENTSSSINENSDTVTRLINAAKESINNRNADPKENEKTNFIYGR